MSAEKDYRIGHLKEMRELLQRIWEEDLDLSKVTFKEGLKQLDVGGMAYRIAGMLWMLNVWPSDTEDIAKLHHQLRYFNTNGIWEYKS